MNFDSNVIKQMIKDLKHSIALHTDSIENIHGDCYCADPKIEDVKCYHCRLQEAIDDLDCLVSNLEPISLNTFNHVQLIDAEAFRYALEQSGSVQSITCSPYYNDPNSEYNWPEVKPDSFTIECTTSRFAMDGNGYHVGYENVTYRWFAIDKSELGIYGLPYLLSRWVIDPNAYEIVNKDLPDDELPDPIDSHDPECEFIGKDFDQCDCADDWNGYFQPDDDFFHQEIMAIIDQLKYPEAEFDSDKREWTLGNCSFNLNDFESNSDYADSIKEENGCPDIG